MDDNFYFFDVTFVTVPTPELTLSRDPNASVTLRHGDPLSLTCTIQLGSAVDSDVVVTGELSGPGGSNGTVVMETMRKYCITQTISSLNTTPSDTYTCNTTIDPAIGVENVLKNTDGYSTLTITVGELSSRLDTSLGMNLTKE